MSFFQEIHSLSRWRILRSILFLSLQKPSLEVVPAADKDSDSACSADMSNTDSGRGSNDDGSDNHFRSASPHWDPNAHHKGKITSLTQTKRIQVETKN